MFGVIGQCVGFTDPAVDKKKLVLDVAMYQALHTLSASTSPVFELAAARHYVTISERSMSTSLTLLCVNIMCLCMVYGVACSMFVSLSNTISSVCNVVA